MSGQQKSVVYGFNIYMLTESRRVNIMKCYTRNLNSYNKGAATMFLRGLRANPTNITNEKFYALYLEKILFCADPLFLTDNCLFQGMLFFKVAPSLLFTYLNFPGFVGLSLSKCRKTKYLSRSPHRIRHLLAACHVQQRSLRLRAVWLYLLLMKAYSTN